jgi:hypothetical protein
MVKPITRPRLNICVRPTPADWKLLQALQAKLGVLHDSEMWRMALRALAEKHKVRA